MLWRIVTTLACLASSTLAAETHGTVTICRGSARGTFTVPAGSHYIQAMGDRLGATVVTDADALLRGRCVSVSGVADQPVAPGSALLFSGSVPGGGDGSVSETRASFR